jgi:nitric oxide reductase large subunit
MSVYADIAAKIIAQQETVIGPVAIEQAKQVKGLSLDWSKKSVSISGNESKVIDELVDQYKTLFGQISVEVCKEAVGRLAQQLSPDQMPASLR